MSLTKNACGADSHTETIRSVSLEAKRGIARCKPHSPHERPSPTWKIWITVSERNGTRCAAWKKRHAILNVAR
ncbi:MAG: hypothetical protein GY880_25480 [Planctomycetaceae bacterium]|nr:hypothetical protein [Planctomycetaceae bacterium]